MTVHCAHCGEPIKNASRGGVDGHPLHHTGTLPPQAPPVDCYRLVTVYRERLGSRKAES